MNLSIMLTVFSALIAFAGWFALGYMDHKYLIDGHSLTCRFSRYNDKNFPWYKCREYRYGFIVGFVVIRILALIAFSL